MKRLLLLMPMLFALALPGTVHAKPGQLDKSFGKNGRVITKIGSAPTGRSHFAWAGGGRIVALLGPRLIEYLPDGRRNKRFGDTGRVKIEPPANSAFNSTDLAVDSRGRILVSGAAPIADATGRQSMAVAVYRFLPDGRPDPSFGSGGRAMTDFGFPHPLRGGALAPDGPFVEPSGMTVGAADRPILTGSWLSETPDVCYLYCSVERGAFVARLTESGSLDQGFGDGGVYAAPESNASVPTRSDGGLLLVASDDEYRGSAQRPELLRLTEAGALDPGFNPVDLQSGGFPHPPAMAVDRDGRILLLPTEVEGSTILLQRLFPSGREDRNFGSEGSEWINVPPKTTSPLAFTVDRRGRAVIATAVSRARHSYFAVSRRSQGGGLDRSFARRGWTMVRFPGLASPMQILIGANGKIVVAGTLYGKGLALARYSGG